MAENKKSFILYADLIHTVEQLPDEKAGLLFKHILKYVNDLSPVTDDLIVSISFEPIKQQLKRDLNKWGEIRVKRSEAGKISAEKRKEQNQQVLTSVESVQQDSTKSTVTVNDNVTVNVNENVNVILLEKETKGFRKPDFIQLVNFLVDEKKIDFAAAEKFAQEFHNHYESNGWKVGKNSMKNWKAALSGWISRANNFKPKQNGADKLTFDEAARKYLDEFGG